MLDETAWVQRGSLSLEPTRIFSPDGCDGRSHNCDGGCTSDFMSSSLAIATNISQAPAHDHYSTNPQITYPRVAPRHRGDGYPEAPVAPEYRNLSDSNFEFSTLDTSTWPPWQAAAPTMKFLRSSVDCMAESPGSVSSTNTTDSGYMSIFSTPRPSQSANASPLLHEDSPLSMCSPSVEPSATRAPKAAKRRGRPSRRPPRQRPSAVNPDPKPEDNTALTTPLERPSAGLTMAGIQQSHPDPAGTQPPALSIETSLDQTKGSSSEPTAAIPTSQEEASLDEDTNADEDMDARSRETTPWPEAWFEGGMDMGLPWFSARFMQELKFHTPATIQDDAHGVNNHTGSGQDSSSGSQDGQDATTSRTLQSDTLRGNPNASNKRSRSDQYGGADDDEDLPGSKKPAPMGPPGDQAGQGLLYACPYQKRYPHDSPFCGMPHGSKRGYGWGTVSRVKQHLLESHGIDHHCSNCWKAFKKVDAARACHTTRNCLKRQSPPKLWLHESQASSLRAEKIDNKSDDSWYRIFGLLFTDKEEHGPEGYRAKYTPYYSRVEYPTSSPSSGFYNGTSPINSIFTPSSNSTNSSGLTPLDPHVPATPSNGLDSQEESHFAAAMSYQEDLLHTFSAMDPLSGQLFSATMAFTEEGSSATLSFAVPNPNDNVEASHEAPAVSLNDTSKQSCQCTAASSPQCASCRRKRWNANLRSENKALRATMEGIRQIVEMHEETLQSMDESNLVSDNVMAKLQGYQDQLREHLSCVR
ncbi:hypothetical protein B0T14DRAFT_525951 [Immersiella caudata]|uniref:Uncharacterized protein n=1 Tax=Immersiella caudata TaxID=314043 RepID=A0AA40BTP2_9PEZI|nr:hypothetical protein B0T14DRAFT_525951 [Immersiella caudata]